MLEELKADLETHKKELSRPAFHRIGFRDSSIYLTKTNFIDARGWVHGSNLKGKYYLFSWTDYRAKAVLGFELGDKSPALGKAILIGDYTPENDDICNVKYSSSNGKAYFKSALAELKGKVLEDEHSVKIDAENFMKMKEIIPTGAQGKAIYGEGDYIIDGPAGTGKSTTVLQKIKLLELQNKISTNAIQVVVKNSKIVPRFTELLSSISINDLSILPVRDFIEENYSTTPSVSVAKLLSLNELAKIASDCLSSIFDTKLLFSATHKLDTSNWEKLCELTKNDQNFSDTANNFLRKAEEIREKKRIEGKTIADKQTELIKSAELQKKNLTQDIVKKNKKSLFKKLGQRIGLSVYRNDDGLSLGDESNIREQVNRFKIKQQKSIDKLKQRLSEASYLAEQSLVEQLARVKRAFVKAIIATEQNDNHKELLSRYCNKHFFDDYQFHTVVIDEAQDVSAIDIELIRLCTRNTILAGDESQTENPEGIGLWSNLAIKETFSKDNNLKIYPLRHNFRQTYELGNVSYNYRQLLLDRGLEDIKSDYFDDQIGFNKPILKLISAEQNFIELVKKQIIYINETFSNSFPLVIFYENHPSLKRFQKLLQNEALSYCTDDDVKISSDILLVNIWEISGREFPVVLAPLTESTSPNSIYIMLSRAKFELTFFTGAGKKIDKHIDTLSQHGLINKYI